jgi:hypothetical protein
MTIHQAQATMQATPYPTCIEVEPVLTRLVGENIGKGWREVVRRKIGRVEGCTHLSELLGPAVTTLFQTISSGRDPNGRDTLENQQTLGTRPFFIGGCHSWRTDGPVVADEFPQFATKPWRGRNDSSGYASTTAHCCPDHEIATAGCALL